MKGMLLLALLSYNISAAELKPIENYKSNPATLSEDMDALRSLESSRHSTELSNHLEQMSVLKANIGNLSIPVTIEKIRDLVSIHNWKTLVKMSSDLIGICHSSSAVDLNSCEDGLSLMKEFTNKSKLSIQNIGLVNNSIDRMLTKINAEKIINHDFDVSFNQRAKLINLEWTKAHKIAPQEISTSAVVAPVPSAGSNHLAIIISSVVSGLIILAGFFYAKERHKKNIKVFYTSFFGLARKNNIQLKIFGNLNAKEYKRVKVVHMPLLNTLYLSRGISNKVQLKFKKRGQVLSVELNYQTNKTIQSVEDQPQEKFLKDDIESLRLVVQDNGGEFLYTNHYASHGQLEQSCLIINFPI